MATSITGTAQTSLDVTVTIPQLNDVASSARFEDTIQTILDDIVTLDRRITSASGGTIADGSITEQKLSADAVTNSKLADNAVQFENINAGAATAGQLLSRTATGLDWVNAPTGGGGTIADGSITGQKLANLTVTGSKIANNTITATQIASATITATQIANNTITATQIANGTITSTQLATDSVTLGKISTTSTGTDGQVLQRTATALNWVTPAAASITDGSITGQKLANKTVTGGKIADTTITASQIANNTITATQIANGTITSTQLATDSVTLGKISTTSTGTDGQVLSRTATGLDWIDAASGGGSSTVTITTISWTPTFVTTEAGFSLTRANTSAKAWRIGKLVFFAIRASITFPTRAALAIFETAIPYGTTPNDEKVLFSSITGESVYRGLNKAYMNISSNKLRIALEIPSTRSPGIMYFSGAYVAN